MPKLIIEVSEKLQPHGEDRTISAFAFSVRMAPTEGDSDGTETVLPGLIPLFFAAIKHVMDSYFGPAVFEKMAPIPYTGIDPLPELREIIADYQAGLDVEFPGELD